MKYGLEDPIFLELLRCIQEEPKVKRAILFGSRARGTHRYNSDIDLALLCEGRIPTDLIFKIEDAVGIYKVDVVDLAVLRNEELKKSIETEGINLLEINE